MDYLAAAGSQVWVPAGNTGKVFVLDGPGKPFRTIDGFATKKGRNDRLMGPSSVSLSTSTAFIGNRGDSSVCEFERGSLKKKSCATIPGIPDGTFWVRQEPRVQTMRIRVSRATLASGQRHRGCAGRP